ncbi:hypothetical protein H6F68_22290 [Trichocoleus sp. FACHB-262]|nr:hypothetical protein [Trichocoleus sp. FACHB-262]
MEYSNQLKPTLFAISGLIIMIVASPAFGELIETSSAPVFPVIADPKDTICHMQRPDGIILKLDDLCGTPETIQPLSATDQNFIRDYRSLLETYPDESPSLLPLTSSNPQAIVQKAKDVCNALDLGTFIEFRKTQSPADINMINAIAPRYYCPGFDN